MILPELVSDEARADLRRLLVDVARTLAVVLAVAVALGVAGSAAAHWTGMVDPAAGQTATTSHQAASPGPEPAGPPVTPDGTRTSSQVVSPPPRAEARPWTPDPYALPVTGSRSCAAVYALDYCQSDALRVAAAVRPEIYGDLVAWDVGGVAPGDTVHTHGRSAHVGLEDREVLAATYWLFDPGWHSWATQRTIPCESEYDQFARYPGGTAHGYYQVLGRLWGFDYDPWGNTRLARGIFDRQGPNAWECN